MEGQNIDLVRIVGRDVHTSECDSLPVSASTFRTPSSRVIDQDSSHHSGRHSEEVSAVAPFHATLIDESRVRLTNQRRRLEGMSIRLSSHVAGGQPAQVRIDRWHEVVERFATALAPGDQQICDLGSRPRSSAMGGLERCPELDWFELRTASRNFSHVFARFPNTGIPQIVGLASGGATLRNHNKRGLSRVAASPFEVLVLARGA